MITVKDISRPPLTFMQNTYYPELWKGLVVTSRHFFENFGRHVLNAMGIKTKKLAMVTILYPEQKRRISPRWRGRHRLMLRPDSTPRCVACMMCETACPDKCIYITAGEATDNRIEKYPVAFEIDLLRCCFCGLCVEACPEDAIRMDTGYLELGGFSREEFYMDKDFLLLNSELTTHSQFTGELDGVVVKRVDLLKQAQHGH